MRTKPITDGALHPPDGGLHDHHAAPDEVSFASAGVLLLLPGALAVGNVPLSRSDYLFAHVHMMGPGSAIKLGLWRESAFVQATTDTAEAQGHSQRDIDIHGAQYHATYSKQGGDSQLTHRLFDNFKPHYITLDDVVIIGAILRLTFKNQHGSDNRSLWVRGQAALW